MKKNGIKGSIVVGICLLGAAVLLIGVFAYLNALHFYPLGGYSWIAGVIVFGLLTAGCILTFKDAYQKMEFSKKTGLWGIIFMLPWILGFALFFMVPMFQELRFSFETVSIKPGGLDESFVQFKNFKNILFEDPNYVKELVETVLQVVLYTVLIIVFSLLCAILLNGKFFGRSVARAVFFIPIVMATGLMIERTTNSANLLMAQSQEDKVYGAAIISKLLFSLGAGTDIVTYLSNAVNDIFEVISLSGIQILIFLAALQGIPAQLYEVAKIEGATSYETFWKVTVAMVSPMILTCTLYTISDLFLRSDLAETFHDVAFKQGQYGLSAAMSTFFLLTIVLIIAAFILPMRKVVFYYD